MECKHIDISDEISTAIKSKTPIVALEVASIFLNLQYPENVELVKSLINAIKEYGVVPALMYVANGRIKVGLSDSDIDFLAHNRENISRISKRDLPIALAANETGNMLLSAVIYIASKVGIKVVSASSIAGVNKELLEGFESSYDIESLSASNVLLVCSGIRPGYNIKETMAKLEEKEIYVAGFKTDYLPSFYYSNSDVRLSYRLETPQAIAVSYNIKNALEIDSSYLLLNPVSKSHEINEEDIEKAITEAFNEARQRDIKGTDFNDYMFRRVRELTNGASKTSFLHNINSNAQLAAWISFAMFKEGTPHVVKANVSDNIKKVADPILTANSNNNSSKIMDFYLWLFAVKRFAQTYDACKMIFNNLSPERQASLKEEFEKTIS